MPHPKFAIRIFIVMLKTDEGREMGSRRYTSRHTSPEDGDARVSRKVNGDVIR